MMLILSDTEPLLLMKIRTINELKYNRWKHTPPVEITYPKTKYFMTRGNLPPLK